MRTRLTATEYALLHELEQGPGHGYCLCNRLAQTGKKAAQSSVYRALHRLLCLNLISGKPVPSDTAPARTVYSITPSGKRHILFLNQDVTSKVEELHAQYKAKVELLRGLL